MTRRLYQPMLAKVAEDAFTDVDWIFEVKWDGFRAIAYLEEPFSLRSRSGKELKQNFMELQELTSLGSNIVVDGEIVVMTGGVPDFQRLLKRGQAVGQREIERQSQRNPAVYIVFDILEKNGEPLTHLPLLKRKAILHESLREGKNVLLCDYIEERGDAYFKLALQRGLEGVVAKKKSSQYEEGLRTGSWLKIKKLKTCDCIVFGYTQGKESRSQTFGALLLGLFDDEGKPVYVGKVGTGFTQKTLRELKDKFEKLQTAETAPFQPESGDVVTWLEPKLVVEVAYQVVTHDQRLRMGRFKRLRDDKKPEQCMLNQIVETKQMEPLKPEQNSPKNPSESNAKLSEYISKRSFTETPEPPGEPKSYDPLIFVVQEHHARNLHYDFRLEKDGVLKSWAVPKGIPQDTRTRRLAVETEDHPYEYARFEGEIPKGQYGAGTVKIWDKGHYTPKLWEGDKIEFTLDGERLKGRYVLVRLKKAEDKKDWLMLKGKDDV